MAKRYPLSIATILVFLTFFLTLLAPGAHSQQTTNAAEWKLRKQAADNVIRIVAEDVNSTSFRAATEIASLLARGDGLRLMTISGRGGAENISDLLFLRDIDLAIVSLDTLERVRAENTFPKLERRVAYVTKLFNEEVHLLASEKASKIQDLAGGRIGVGPKEGSGDYSARTVFGAANVQYTPVYDDYALALQKLQKGELDAVISVSGKPVRMYENLPKTGLRLLPVPVNLEKMPDYIPASIDAGDYPGLISEGQNITTVAVQNVLLSFNWKQDTKRYRKVSEFINQFFPKSGELKKRPNHPKWQEFNMSARLDNWIRVKAAVDAAAKPVVASNFGSCSAADLRAAFTQYLAEANIRVAGEISKTDAEQIFKGFKDWVNTGTANQ
ncbi:MAG: TAXI family TRAP transporter solute-binding subunit [Anderseniella sp.]